MTVTVTNTFSDVRSFGFIDVFKIISPSGGTATIGDEYEVRVQCFDDAAPPNEVYDQTTTLVFDTTMSHTFNSIPLPASCTVTETSLPANATLVAYVPNGGTPTTPPTIPLTVADNSASVVITNSYTNVGGQFTGSVNIGKRVDRRAAGARHHFVIHVACTGPTVNASQDITLVYSSALSGSFSFVAPSDESVQCTVTETTLGGAVSASISPNNGLVTITVAAPVADVAVTNHYGDPAVEVGGARAVLPFTGSDGEIAIETALWLLVIGLACVAIERSVRKRKRTL